MSVRILQAPNPHVRGLPLARLAAPALLVAAGLSLGAVHWPPPRAPRTVADQVGYAGPTAVMPFAATPHTYPFQTRTIEVRRSVGPATGQVVTLTSSLDVTPGTVPRRVLAAYVNATHLTNVGDPTCLLRWQMLAGIGFIESDNALGGGSANPHWNGVAKPAIFGPLVKGKGRAIGPMQIMASTWAVYAADGNHDGVRNPQDIDDASLAAAHYLCAAAQALNEPKHLIRALHAYNHSYTYVRAVLTAIASYLHIDPAALGINGLPNVQPRGHPPLGAPVPPPVVTVSPTPSGTPSPTPTPTATATPRPFPLPTQSWSPPPSPSTTPPQPHLPGH